MTSTYLEPARGENNQIWRYIVTIIAMFWAMVGVGMILVLIVFAIEGTMDYTKLSPMATLLVNLLPFPVMLTALWAGLKFLHKRSLKTLLQPRGRVHLGQAVVLGGFVVRAGRRQRTFGVVGQPGNYRGRSTPRLFYRSCRSFSSCSHSKPLRRN